MQNTLNFEHPGNAAQNPAPIELTPVQICAISGAMTGKKLTLAKSSIKDGASLPFDFTIRVSGTLTKGMSTDDKTEMVPAQVSYTGLTSVCALLRELGITPRKLKNAFSRLPALSAMQVDAELSSVFDGFAKEVSAMLPQVPNTTPGKSGSVTANATVTVVSSAPGSN